MSIEVQVNPAPPPDREQFLRDMEATTRVGWGPADELPAAFCEALIRRQAIYESNNTPGLTEVESADLFERLYDELTQSARDQGYPT
jgi:hypothetical protein